MDISFKPWSSEEEVNLITFYNKKINYFSSDVALANAWITENGSNRGVEAVCRKIRRLKKDNLLPSGNFFIGDLEFFRKGYLSEVKYDQLREELNSFLGRTSKLKSKLLKEEQEYEKTLVIGDTHVPLTKWDCLFRVIDIALSQGIKRCWLNGDVYDFDYFSRFNNAIEFFIGPDGKKYPFTLENELHFGMFFREYLCQRFDVVYELQGNHSERPYKYFLRKDLSKELVFLLKKRQEVLLFGKEYENYKIVKTKLSEGLDSFYYGNLGDCGLCHFDFVSNRTKGKQARDADFWFKRWEKFVPEVKNYELIIQGHSHGAVKMVGDYGRVIMESPSLCVVMPYMLSGASYPPPATGYIILVQENGKTNVNATNFYLME